MPVPNSMCPQAQQSGHCCFLHVQSVCSQGPHHQRGAATSDNDLHSPSLALSARPVKLLEACRRTLWLALQCAGLLDREQAAPMLADPDMQSTIRQVIQCLNLKGGQRFAEQTGQPSFRACMWTAMLSNCSSFELMAKACRILSVSGIMLISAFTFAVVCHAVIFPCEIFR